MPPPPPPPPPPRELQALDPDVWRACAGTAVWIPTAGSTAYYFPQGHAEQSSAPPDFSALPSRHPLFRCRVDAVTYLADPDTDEVFAKILLDPRPSPALQPAPEPSPAEDPNKPRAHLFHKILTPSDANNGGGFSVPRSCADIIFPPLDFAADPPVQTITVRDAHGIPWPFRHIYRGTPRRHLLTTGWSKFVNSKKLVGGDTVVFIKDSAGELFVGIRRAGRSCGASDWMRHNPLPSPPAGDGAKSQREVGPGQGFSRNLKGRVTPESVVEAAILAEMNRPFEVYYYPSVGFPEFVVSADVVEAAAKVCWAAGMVVKMSMENEDSSRVTWFQGKLSGTAAHDPGQWPGSPWRMLQVTWEEPEILHNLKSVNPWQLEIPSMSHIQAPYPTIKKSRASPSSELLNDAESNMKGFTSTMMGNATPPFFNHGGIQGARHNSSREFNLSNLICINTHPLFFNNHNDSKLSEKLIDVSTELSIGSTSQSESSSPQSQSSNIQQYGTELPGNTPSKTTKGPFQLFGQIIQTEPSDFFMLLKRGTKRLEM